MCGYRGTSTGAGGGQAPTSAVTELQIQLAKSAVFHGVVEIGANQRGAGRDVIDGCRGVADSRQRDASLMTDSRQGDGIVASRMTTVNGVFDRVVPLPAASRRQKSTCTYSIAVAAMVRIGITGFMVQ